MVGRRHSRRVAISAALACSLMLSAMASGASQPKPGQQPPVNTSPPTITGDSVIGQLLTGNPGAWEGRGLKFSYQWLRCDSSGGACSAIAAASGMSYTIVVADGGASLRFQVYALSRNGSTTAVSAATRAIVPVLAATPPVNSSAPVVTGTPQVGNALAASPGAWAGTEPMSYAYQWGRCDPAGSSCAPIAGATDTSYSLSGADVGQRIRVTVTASNAADRDSADSDPTAVVEPASGSPAVQPSFPIHATFYYPWYPETWTVNGAHVFYHPTLGYSSTTDVTTQTAHIRAMEYAGMEAAISSWWGAGHYTNSRLKQLMQTTLSLGSTLKWAVYHEYEGYGDPSVDQLTADLAAIRDGLASSPAYLHVGGKFVVFVYAADDTTCELADRWKQANDRLGNPAYVDLKVFLGYRSCINQPNSWHQYGPDAPADEQSGYSYSISPGFWRADATAAQLPRDPVRWKSNVAAMVASDEPWKLVTTFNEWTEGTAIEPATEWASASGYGTYLDALHDAIPTP